ncbi:omptin family outer membrane protease [Symbiopectobacterium sp. Eva_TO]
MKPAILALSISVPVFFSTMAGAESRIFTPESLSGEIEMGSLSGKTKERVYYTDDPGYKVSQLNWKYNRAAIIKGSLEWNLIPQLSVGASGWTTISSRGGYMDDTDWADKSKKEWTKYSEHPATHLNYANEFSLNVKWWFLNEPNYRFGVMAGYQEKRYSFSVLDYGFYDYTDEETGLREQGFSTSRGPGGGYKQRFKIPYIGLSGSYRYQRFELGGSFKYSGWVCSSDNDEHYLRKITFRSNVKNQNFYSLAGNVGYYLTPNAKIYVEGTWNRTTNKKGKSRMIDYSSETETVNEPGGISGIENYNFMTTVGLKYSF